MWCIAKSIFKAEQIRKLFAILGCAFFALSCTSILKAERLPIKTYTVAEGLLRDNVSKIKQDSRGFLWFGTNDGVSRFDGYGFTNYTVANGLPVRQVRDFLETQAGAIWIATEGGLAKLDPQAASENRLFIPLLPENPKAKFINVLFEDENGTVFAGTEDGLYKITESNEFKLINLGKPPPHLDRLSIRSIIKDRRGAMWIGSESGLYRILPDGAVEHFAAAEGLPKANITTVFEDRKGRIWIGFRPGGILGLALIVTEPQKNQNIVEWNYTEKDGLPNIWITDLYEAPDGKFWVGTARGLCLWQTGENSVCKTYTGVNNICDTEIWAISGDKDENLWFGTRCGVKKLARYGFTAYDEPNGTKNASVNSIFENASGEIFASYNDGIVRTVSRFDGEKFENIKPAFSSDIKYFGWGNRHTVLQDKAGDWWFPTAAGLYKSSRPAQFKDLAKMIPQRIANLQDSQIFRLFEDSQGNFWISGIKPAGEKLIYELWLRERNTDNWRDLTKELSLSADWTVVSFAEDKTGNIWIGTNGGNAQAALIRFSGRNFKIFTKAGDETLSGEMISLFVDSKNRLWAANPLMGLLRLDDVNADELNFTRYTPAEGLSTIGVITVTEDAYGRIYIGTARGLDRLIPETGQIENFSTADGLPASFVETSYRDRQNNLWFGTDKGIARFTPEPERIRKPPNILITGLHISGVAQPVSILGDTAVQNIELNADQKQITIDFLGLGANLGEKLNYEYRFADGNWTATGERTINFANLAPGAYKFEVRAVTANRIYSQTPAVIAFRIASPLWQRWWFLVLVLVFIAGLVYLIYSYRLKRLLELERVRTRIATDLHDDIGANLTRILLVSEVAKQKAENGNGQLLNSIADIARESVASMNDIVWAISPEHDSLLDLTRRMRQHAEEVFALRDIDLEFNAPTDSDVQLNVSTRRDVLLIFKEAINNIAKHSECSKVGIAFSFEHSVLKLHIKDNGKGFSPDVETDGQGLRSMSRRADALGGKLTITADHGTNVEFELRVTRESFV